MDTAGKLGKLVALDLLANKIIENLASEAKAPSGLKVSKSELVLEVRLRLKEDLFGSVGVVTVQNKVDLDGRMHVNPIVYDFLPA